MRKEGLKNQTLTIHMEGKRSISGWKDKGPKVRNYLKKRRNMTQK